MATKDPNKIYYQDKEGNVSEVKKMSRQELDTARNASRARFQANREKYRQSGGITKGTDGGRSVNSTYNTYE